MSTDWLAKLSAVYNRTRQRQTLSADMTFGELTVICCGLCSADVRADTAVE